MRRFRQAAGAAGMRAWIGAATAMIMEIQIAQDPDGHQFAVSVHVKPEGKTARPAKTGEVLVRLQDMHLGSWRTIEESLTGNYGVAYIAIINRQPRLNQGDYRITAQHVTYQAEVGQEFQVYSDFSVGPFGAQYVVHEGSEAPADFEQRIVRQPANFNQSGSTYKPDSTPNMSWTGRGWTVE